jgi:exodeoxyribonuclease VII small subunit
MKKELTYSAALEELKRITEEMEQGLVGVDDLSAKVARSAELIDFCKKKLYETDQKVQSILNNLDEPDSENN